MLKIKSIRLLMRLQDRVIKIKLVRLIIMIVKNNLSNYQFLLIIGQK